MEQLNIFQRVKQYVTTRQAASFYGIEVKRNGMCRCPFHDDKTPSMKVDERFHCFGCEADGDVIDFVSRLKAIGVKDAAECIAADFYIDVGDVNMYRSTRQEKKILYRNEEDRLRVAVNNFFRRFTDYYHTLREWKEMYEPKSPEEDWDRRFCEALERLHVIEYALDCFLEGDFQEQIQIMNEYREEVKAHEKRIKRSNHAESGRLCA